MWHCTAHRDSYPLQSIQVDTDPVTGTGERLLLKATTVALPGLGQLEIAPGGADLAALRRRKTELADRQAALLQRMGLASLEDAEVRHQTHTQRLAEIKTAAATLKALHRKESNCCVANWPLARPAPEKSNKPCASVTVHGLTPQPAACQSSEG